MSVFKIFESVPAIIILAESMLTGFEVNPTDSHLDFCLPEARVIVKILIIKNKNVCLIICISLN